MRGRYVWTGSSSLVSRIRFDQRFIGVVNNPLNYFYVETVRIAIWKPSFVAYRFGFFGGRNFEYCWAGYVESSWIFGEAMCYRKFL